MIDVQPGGGDMPSKIWCLLEHVSRLWMICVVITQTISLRVRLQSLGVGIHTHTQGI